MTLTYACIVRVIWCPMALRCVWRRSSLTADVFPVHGASFARCLVLIAALTVALFILAWCVRVVVQRRSVGFGCKQQSAPAAGAQASLSVSGIALAHGSQTLIKQSSFTLEPGRIVGLVAPNGRGKTTLLEAIAGKTSLLRAGGITYGGIPCSRRPEYAKHVFFVPGNADWTYAHLTSREHLNLIAAFWCPKARFDRVLSYCGISSFEHKCAGGIRAPRDVRHM